MSSALLTAAKHDRGQLRCAISSITIPIPDKRTQPIRLLGVAASRLQYCKNPLRFSEAASPHAPAPSQLLPHFHILHNDSLFCRRSLSSLPSSPKNPGAHWSPEFYGDFTSRVWIISLTLPHSRLVTYRPRTRTGRGRCSRRTNADLIQSFIKTLVVRRREGMAERC